MQSRYYDPELGRFINADAYVSTGQGILGNNMFAYCNNNPVTGYDPTGQLPVLGFLCAAIALVAVVLSGCSSQPTSTEAYPSADAAAMAFANEVYSSSQYTLHEYSTEIYTTTINGETYYHYTTPTIGTPHCAEGIDMNRVNNVVAYAHTHIYSNAFSGPDKEYAADYKVDAYVVGPDLTLLRYDYINDKTIPLDPINPVPLSETQKKYLASLLQNSWDAHMVNGVCPKGFNCETLPWPNE